jgi:hypothetical protein
MSEYAGWGSGDIYEMRAAMLPEYPQEDDKDVLEIYADLIAPGGAYDPFTPQNFSEVLSERLLSDELLHTIRRRENDVDAMNMIRGVVMAYWHRLAMEQALIDADELRREPDYGDDRGGDL